MKHYIMFVLLMIGIVMIAGCVLPKEESKPRITSPSNSLLPVTVIISKKEVARSGDNHAMIVFDKKGLVYVIKNESLYDSIQVNKTYVFEFDSSRRVIKVSGVI